jgi:hypothetical protein
MSAHCIWITAELVHPNRSRARTIVAIAAESNAQSGESHSDRQSKACTRRGSLLRSFKSPAGGTLTDPLSIATNTTDGSPKITPGAARADEGRRTNARRSASSQSRCRRLQRPGSTLRGRLTCQQLSTASKQANLVLDAGSRRLQRIRVSLTIAAVTSKHAPLAHMPACGPLPSLRVCKNQRRDKRASRTAALYLGAGLSGCSVVPAAPPSRPAGCSAAGVGSADGAPAPCFFKRAISEHSLGTTPWPPAACCG